MADPKKLVKNTLFNPSVTGSTYEEFSQHAVLFPAMEKPPQPIVNISTGESSICIRIYPWSQKVPYLHIKHIIIILIFLFISN